MYEIPYIVDDSRPPLADDYIEHIEELIATGRRSEVVSYFRTEAVGMPAETAEQMSGATR